jgi:hypothetical protein
MEKLCTNKNNSYKHNIDNSECFGVKFVKIYQKIILATYCTCRSHFSFPKKKTPKETKMKNPWLGNTCILI